jgi:hypothetical protein
MIARKVCLLPELCARCGYLWRRQSSAANETQRETGRNSITKEKQGAAALEGIPQ